MRPSNLVVVLSLSGAFGIVLFGRGEADRPPVRTLLPALPTLVSTGNACPLSPAEEKRAVEKFDEMWPVLRHPRCFNCHGAVNPFVEEARGHHRGGKIPQPENARAALDLCEECHYVRNWDTPAELFFFTDRSARQLCMQFKKAEESPTVFVRHMYNDKGGTPFIATAFKGDRALNSIGEDTLERLTGRPFELEQPPMTHGEFVQIASDWANLVGERGWTATPDCGCGRRKSAWTGTVTGVWNLDLDGRLHVVEKTTANVRFELDTTYAPGPDLYWKSVSGELEWSTEITGECRASASGMLPIDQGADDNPLATLSLQTGLGGGPRYMVGVGPWRDEYQPRFTVRCPEASFPGILYGLGVFWHHPDPGMISPDGKTLQGSFQAAHPAGTNAWTWDLQLEQLPTDESP
jgi:hypothetical protein